MKKFNYATLVLLTITLFTFCIACNQQTDAGTPNLEVRDADPIEGVWELSSRYWYLDDDTLYADPPNGTIHKIYFDGYMMWTLEPGADSSEWHGFGTYRISNDTLIEKLLSMSLPLQQAMGTDEEAVLTIEYGEDFYKQTMDQEFRDTIYKAVEEYKRLN